MGVGGDGDVFGGLFWDSDGGYGRGVSVQCVVDFWESDVYGEHVVFFGVESLEGEVGGGAVDVVGGGDVCGGAEVRGVCSLPFPDLSFA